MVSFLSIDADERN